MKFEKLTVEELARSMERGERSSEEITAACLSGMEQAEPTVGAFLTVDSEGALQAARASDERRRNGSLLHRLDGIPFAVKDNFCTKGLRTTAASHMLEQYIPPYTATAVQRLQDAGCVLLGKLNMDEFAMGSSTQHSALGITRNPLDPTRVPGGSSGGSAAAVAAGEVPFTLGSDTGGSVRQPASFCGVMGLKPTYGVISRYGMIAFASSLDCVGIVANTVRDTADVLGVLAGKDPMDATSLDFGAEQFAGYEKQNLKGMRIAIVPDAGSGTLSAEVERSVLAASGCFRDAGAKIGYVRLPSPEQALLSYCAISAVEASSNLARYDGVRYGCCGPLEGSPEELFSKSRGMGFGKEVKLRILLGTAMHTGEKRERLLKAARRVKQEVSEALNRIFESYDIIVKPTATNGAFRLDETVSALKMREMDICTVYANLAGIPALSVPLGKDANGMPLGMQIMAPKLGEKSVFSAARVLELAFPDGKIMD